MRSIIRKCAAALAAFVICGAMAARATTLTGTVRNPDGSAFTGVIYLTLSQPGTVSSSGTCGGPAYVSSLYKVSVTVTNGSIVNSPQIYDSMCFTTPGIPYDVQMVNTSSQSVTQIWVVTSSPLQTGSENVGTIIPLSVSNSVFSLPAAANVASLLFGTTSIPMSSTAPSGSTNYLCVISSKIAGCAGSGQGASMTWPTGGAGIPNYNGSSAYGTTYNASNQIPGNFVAPASATNFGAMECDGTTTTCNNGVVSAVGNTGAAGAAATVAAGTATALAAGTSPTVSNAGTSSAAIFNFGIPVGAAGAPGAAATVAAGTVTALAAGASPTVTNVGTSNAAIFNFGIPAGAAGATGATGATGSTGAPGAAATITIGTVTTGAPGTAVSVTNSGTANAAILNFVIPQGLPGGSGGTTTTSDWTNIGTVQYTGDVTSGNFSMKTCYVGSSVCSGGVGTNAPAVTPTNIVGQNTPSAGTGTANAVGVFTLQSSIPNSYTDALWTISPNGGEGIDSTATNFAREFWVKAAFAAGKTNIEFDIYAFDDGWDWMWGNQCNGASNLIQYDNQGNGWVNTSAVCGTLYDGNWHHVQETFHRDLVGTNNCSSGTAPCVYWDTISIDGVVTAINKSLPAVSSSWQSSGGQWQLDMDPTSASSGSPATDILYVDTDVVQAGTAPTGAPTGPAGDGGSTSGTGSLASYNFDSGTSSSVGLTSVGSPAYSTSNFHTSPNSASFPAGNNYYTASLSGPTSQIYSRQYVYISSLGTNANGFLRYYNGGAELGSWYFAATSGTITYFNSATGSNISTGASLAAGSIHLIETYTNISPTAGSIIVKVDGTVVYTSATNLNTGAAGTTVNTVWFGQIGNTTPAGWGTTYMDNVDFDNSNWIGPI